MNVGKTRAARFSPEELRWDGSSLQRKSVGGGVQWIWLDVEVV